MKKYFSLSEISKILKKPPHKIRYAEKSFKIEVYKINNRSYYTVLNIKDLFLLLNNKEVPVKEIERRIYLLKINILIKNLKKLKHSKYS